MTNQPSNEQHWKLLVLILKKIAEKKSISHQNIADETGMMKSHVTRLFALRSCPTLRNFTAVARAINVNVFFEDKDGESDLAQIFEAAMTELGRRPGQTPKN